MNKLQPTSTASYVDYAQRRYRWVGPRGRQWYRMVLLTILGRRSSRHEMLALHVKHLL
ncbi:hypothetical protein [Hymenobacter volaticus]|uniref:Uncharacterized protein n=1 Tax=Hymenobacter volaticus TaxID=2932254 RepID=A0ABY4GBM1_9BACT|nr:hypothetical protein [Hymenobacter volaticus]UOQ68305.1 hypothetical protein MUN86_10880 [Hymenobacter volaticus]